MKKKLQTKDAKQSITILQQIINNNRMIWKLLRSNIKRIDLIRFCILFYLNKHINTKQVSSTYNRRYILVPITSWTHSCQLCNNASGCQLVSLPHPRKEGLEDRPTSKGREVLRTMFLVTTTACLAPTTTTHRSAPRQDLLAKLH